MDYSVAIFEFKSVAVGIQASDDALKSAGVHLVSAEPVCPGKFELLLTGELAQVNAAFEKLARSYEDSLLDAIQIGRVEQSVMHALLGASEVTQPGALGIVETYSVASAIRAADTAVKAANVEIVELRVARGMAGKGFVALTGHVADVNAAVEAGGAYAKEQGLFAASTVVPAPHGELWDLL